MTPKIVFTYHAMDRIAQRFPEITKFALRQELIDPSKWVRSTVDHRSGGNLGDGLKLKVDLRVKERNIKAVVIKKVEEGRPTLVVLSAHT